MPIVATSEKRTGRARKGKQLPGLTWTNDLPAINIHTSLPSGAGQASGSGQQRPNPPTDSESDNGDHHDSDCRDSEPHDSNHHDLNPNEDNPHDESPVAHMATKKH